MIPWLEGSTTCLEYESQSLTAYVNDRHNSLIHSVAKNGFDISPRPAYDEAIECNNHCLGPGWVAGVPRPCHPVLCITNENSCLQMMTDITLSKSYQQHARTILKHAIFQKTYKLAMWLILKAGRHTVTLSWPSRLCLMLQVGGVHQNRCFGRRVAINHH